MKLTNWYFVKDRLVGNIKDDDNNRFEDGRQIMTSKVVYIITKEGYQEAVTKSGSVYKLYEADRA